MRELLYASALLMRLGWMSLEEYRGQLDALFGAHPEDDFLLELETRSGNARDTVGRICAACEEGPLDRAALGRRLFAAMERVYGESGSLEAFAARAGRLFEALPVDFQFEEPYVSLLEAEECLRAGDVRRARERYARAFAFYPSNEEHHDE